MVRCLGTADGVGAYPPLRLVSSDRMHRDILVEGKTPREI